MLQSHQPQQQQDVLTMNQLNLTTTISNGDNDEMAYKLTAGTSTSTDHSSSEGITQQYTFYKMRYFGLFSLVILNIVCACK